MGRYAMFNGLVYGGGTAVIPNPEGTPTDELHSIQIDEDIYEIVGGGGSGGNASLNATTLYDTPITSTGTYTLADDYNNYDFIGFKAGNGSTETDIRLYAVKDIQDSMNDNLVITNNVTNSWFNFTINANELTIPGKTVSTIYSVIGYKIKGGSSGASAIEKTQNEYNALPQDQKENGAIYMVQGEVGEEKDLTERMSDYTSSSGTVSAYNSKSANFLAWHALASEDSFDARVNGEYWAGIGDGAYLQFDFTKPVMILKIGFASYLASNFKIMYSTDGNEYIYAQNVTREAQSGYICTKTETTLNSPIRDCVSIRLICDGAEYNVGALHFYGYDSVESVNKIYYMGTEYANTNGGSGGGGDGYKIEKIFDGNVTTSGNITLTKSLNNYDELVFITNFTRELGESYISSFNVDVSIFKNIGSYTATRGVLLNDWSKDTRFAQVKYVDDTTIDVESIQVISIVEIYGVKHSAGGGGGSTVVPNPQEEPTDTLNTVEIDGVVYNIEGGSEGGQGLNPANYSTEEEVIGVWTNNLPVYKKTWTFSSAITVGSNSWADTSISVNDTQIHTIVNCEAVGPNGQAWTCISATTDEATQTYVRILNTRDTNVAVKHLTLYYIKDGDSPIVPPGTDGIYNFYGGFIDTSNIIDSGTYTNTFSYTATEDCFINIAVVMSANDSATITIDGELVTSGWCASLNTINPILPLKKGQTLVATASASNASNYTVYGISYGSGGSSSGSSIDYSTEEKEVGTWIDGSVLYSKTFTFTNREISNTSETNIGNVTGSTPIKQFINAFLTSSIYGTYSSCACYLDNGDLVVTTDIRAQYDTITIQYTKVVS